MHIAFNGMCGGRVGVSVFLLLVTSKATIWAPNNIFGQTLPGMKREIHLTISYRSSICTGSCHLLPPPPILVEMSFVL